MQKMLALLGAKSKEEFVALLAQFIKFGLVGVSNTAVSMAVYYIFLWISPDLYMVGSVLGTILSIANAFFCVDRKHFVVYLSLNVHNLLMIKFSGIVTSKFTIGAIVLLTLKNVTSIQSKTLERIDVPP